MDCLYFVKHYAKFKNDKGHTLVKLREYQEQLTIYMAQKSGILFLKPLYWHIQKLL